MHLLTKLLALAWVGILGVIAAAYSGVEAAAPAALALLNYQGGIISPVSVLGAVTILWTLIDWRVDLARRKREEAVIIRDKPGLANDPKALARERKVRKKEFKLHKLEEKALKKENRAERKLAKEGKKENKLERKREELGMKKEQLRERESLGRR